MLHQQVALCSSIETSHQPIDISKRTTPGCVFENWIAPLEKIELELGIVRNEHICAAEQPFDRDIVYRSADQMVVGKSRHERDPRIEFYARIFQPTHRPIVRNDLASIVHPYEHERELDDGIIFPVEARGFEIDNRNATTIGRNAIIGKSRIGFGDAAQHGVPGVVLQNSCVFLEHWIEGMGSHFQIPFRFGWRTGKAKLKRKSFPLFMPVQPGI
tara:strand:- start:1007 stop:1651 length:645 start_codon:yes stop_codon:yes gene_type:complete